MLDVNSYQLDQKLQPLSVLAVKPKTLAPPPFIIPEKTKSKPYVAKSKNLFPVSTSSLVTPNPIFSPRNTSSTLYPSIIDPKYKINVRGESSLLPYVPNPYQNVSSTSMPQYKVVLPTVSSSFTPTVVPEISPKYPPQFYNRPPSNISPQSLPISSAKSSPASILGIDPPISNSLSLQPNIYSPRKESLLSQQFPISNVSPKSPRFVTIPSPLAIYSKVQ